MSQKKLLVLKDKETEKVLGFVPIYKVFQTNIKDTVFLQLREDENIGYCMTKEEFEQLPTLYESLENIQLNQEKKEESNGE
jgi:hypothetical protein